MGNICAEIPEEDPTLDPVSGLTQREQNLIKDTWVKITENATLKEKGVQSSVKLFTKHPELVDFFPEFVKKDRKGVLTSLTVRTHGISMIYALTAYIECLDDPNTLLALFRKLAATHVSYGVTLMELEKLQEAFIEFLQEHHGITDIDEACVAWNKLLTLQNSVYSQISDQMNMVGGTSCTTTIM